MLDSGYLMIIKLSQELYDRCRKFAEHRIKGSKGLYAYRGEQNQQKMIEDVIVGTMCEWGAFEYLKSKGIITSEPDMVIYETKRKSFSADLASETCKIHVKGQSSSSYSKYGYSWLLQRKDKITACASDSEYFIFASNNGLEVEILGICKVKDIVDGNLFGECKVYQYRHTKVALYLKDLIEAGIDLEAL